MIWNPPYPPSPLKTLARIGTLLAVGGGAYLWKKYQQNKGKDTMQNASPSQVYEEPYPFGKMETAKGKIALKSVVLNGTIEGLLFSSTLIQEYKNEETEALEVIYTFPLGWNTALLGLRATIADRELTGIVVEKAEAEKQYEDAISNGDSAIMVQKSSMGLYTANIGNIKAGETVKVEIHCAQLLNVVQGQARLCIPTVIGERYGDPHCAGGLASHESADVEASAKYPFTLNLELHGDIARGEIFCPSHTVKTSEIADGMAISLDAGAALDRDFVLLLKGLQNNSSALCIKEDDSSYMVAASFAPQMQRDNISPLGLKILVDCSGSMSGESIGQARKGLQKVLSLLNPEDMVSFSRFGSNVEHLSDHLQACDSHVLQNLSEAIAKTDANMGGTEMNAALLSVLRDIRNPGEIPAVMLLITDGDVWDVKNIISSAKEAGHRIFIVGVGSAPAESFLQDMARQTGGACEFVTPNENMAEAIVRMFQRMRGAIASNIHITWGARTKWQSKAPKFIYDGETVHTFAVLDSFPASAPKLQWQADGTAYETQAAAVETAQNEDLLRIGRKRQMEECQSKEEKLEIALKYQLVSDITSLILVYERPDDEKFAGPPKIRQVPQMPAYGHGCNMGIGVNCLIEGVVGPIMRAPFPKLPYPKGFPWFGNWMNQKSSMDMSEILDNLARQWNMQVMSLKTVQDFINQQPAIIPDLDTLLEKVSSTINIQREAVGGLFMIWVLKKTGKLGENERHSMRLINSAIKSVPDSLIAQADQKFEEWYSNN